MKNRFFFITTYDNISGGILSAAINTHPDIHCHTSYPDIFLPNFLMQDREQVNFSLDKFMMQNTATEKKFSGNAQRFSGFELQHKNLVEKTAHPYNSANIIIAPKLRTDLILHSWMKSNLDEQYVLAFIEQKCLFLEKKHFQFEIYNFNYYYKLLNDTVALEKMADLRIAKNKLFLYALAKTITYDCADIPTPGKKFIFENLLANSEELVNLIKHITNNKALVTNEFKKNLNSKLNELQNSVKQLPFSAWEPWQTDLMEKFIKTKLHTIYSPHIDKSLSTLYAEAGSVLPFNTAEKKPQYTKIISIQLNSNRPAQLSAYFDNIEETADNPADVEVLVNIDIGNTAMKSLIENNISFRKFTLKYVETERPASFCDLWKPINKLLQITDPGSYFLVNISDEMLFATHGWDTILKKYVAYFPDNLFRLRASRNKFRNYFDRWECSFAQDAIPITTKKWIDVGGDWNPCFGPDSFQQLISFYLSKEGMFSNSHYLREMPFTEIKFAGDVPALGIDAEKSWRHNRDHLIAMQICQSYPMQLEARRRAIMIKAHIIAHEKQLRKFEVITEHLKKKISLYDLEKNCHVGDWSYNVNRWSIFLTNQWRKLAFFNYFGDGPHQKITPLSFLRYLKAKYLWGVKLYKVFCKIKNLNPLRIFKIFKIFNVKIVKKRILTHYYREPFKEENARLKELYKAACIKNETLQNYLIETKLSTNIETKQQEKKPELKIVTIPKQTSKC
jgi:hypothetical protein